MGENGVINIVGGPVTVSPDGTISVNGAVAGKIKLVEFPAGTPLESVGATYSTAPLHSETAATHSAMAQGLWKVQM